jgi:hypothetical protein
MPNLKTMSRAVSCESTPVMRIVRRRTVVKALSLGFEVRKIRPMLGRKIQKRKQCLAVFQWAINGLVVFRRVLLGKDRHGYLCRNVV